ncbi:hypothetical protein B0H15DRAFT_924299 [Mycena belliarum]|uniref:Uncharacterized protein n=1 Tax=Mycena belliarum TaxID=1033014 RepID=A0AAD6TVL7_9AGAR|nr:hypothetical protein B0H15DRAFT_924299 [Mycena belliae]
MKFLYLFLAATTISLSGAVTIPGEGAYAISNLVDLPEQPTDVSQALANKLLDVLENYGLTKNFGVVAVHSHTDLAPGQVMFQHGNATFTHQEIQEYAAVKDEGVPYNYRITTDAAPALLPLDLGDITPGANAARADLASAMAGNFLQDFAKAAAGHLTGIAYIRPLDRNALENGEVVKNHYNDEKTAGTANAINLADANPADEPSFFTRGVGNSTAASDITILCGACGHGNPWVDRR